MITVILKLKVEVEKQLQNPQNKSWIKEQVLIQDGYDAQGSRVIFKALLNTLHKWLIGEDYLNQKIYLSHLTKTQGNWIKTSWKNVLKELLALNHQTKAFSEIR